MNHIDVEFFPKNKNNHRFPCPYCRWRRDGMVLQQKEWRPHGFHNGTATGSSHRAKHRRSLQSVHEGPDAGQQLGQIGRLHQRARPHDEYHLKNQTLHDQAVSLSIRSKQWQKHCRRSHRPDARQAALDAISSRLALVSELINYSGDLEKLLVTLQGHFTGASIKPGDVQTIVNQINTDVNAINNFNSQAQQSMVQFDTLTNK